MSACSVRSAVGRWLGGRRAAGVAAVCVALLVAVLPAAPAYAKGKPTPTPTPTTSTPSPTPTTSAGVIDCFDPLQAAASGGACAAITPTFSCVWNNGNGSYTAALGYTNPSGYTLQMPVGTYVNSFYGKAGEPNDWGQPTLYPPGTSTTAFTVTWSQPWQYTIKWALGDKHTVAFSSASSACTSKPVPIVATAGAAVLALLVIMVIFGVANKRAERRLSK